MDKCKGPVPLQRERERRKDNALYWLNECVRILRGAIQPIERVLFATWSYCSRYRCSGTGPQVRISQ